MPERTHRYQSTALLRLVLGVALIVATVRLVTGDFDTIARSLENASLLPIVAVAVIFLLTRLTDALYMLLLYRPAAPTLSFAGAVRLVLIQGVAALAIPRFGNIAGAAWLKTVHGLGMLRFTGIHLAATLLNAATVASIGLVAVLAGARSAPAAIILVCALAGSVAAILLGTKLHVQRTSRLRRAAMDVHEGFNSLAARRGRLGLVVLFQGWAMAARTARIACSIVAVAAVWPDGAGVFVAGSLADLATLVAITPAGLGLREAAATAAATVAGVGVEEMLAAVVLDRIIGVAGTLLLGFPLTLSKQKAT
jgi:uncharacterized membrane protein YbhN (UPF0104 family)